MAGASYRRAGAYKRQRGFGTKHPYKRQKGYGQRGGGPKWDAFKKKVKSFSPVIKKAIGASIKKALGDLMSNGLPKGREGWKKVGKDFLHNSGRNLVNEAREQYGFGRPYRNVRVYVPKLEHRIQPYFRV